MKPTSVRKREKQPRRRPRPTGERYRQLVDEEIEHSIPSLLAISEEIKACKQQVMDNFKTILEMKSELFKTKVRDDQRRTDGYRDTVEEGISIVKEYIEGLALRITSRALRVDGAETAQPRCQKVPLKASRIVQLRKIAMDTGTPGSSKVCRSSRRHTSPP